MGKEFKNGSANVVAKVVITQDRDELLTTRDNQQWTGQMITPQLAKFTINVLSKYLKEKGDEVVPCLVYVNPKKDCDKYNQIQNAKQKGS